MKKIILILLTAVSVYGYAQQATDNLDLSLQQAIDLGLKNRYDVQANKYNLDIDENKIGRSEKEWLPEISGSGNMRYSPQLQATLIPAGFFGPDPALVALGAKSVSVFGLDLAQTIYKPGITVDVKIAKNNLELEQEKNKQAENTIKEKIALAYLNVLLKELQTKIASDDEQRYKEYADVAEGKLKLGTLIENDYLKAKLDYENAKVETQKAKQNYELAMDNLKYQINVSGGTKLTLTDNLESPAFSASSLAIKGDATNRTEIKQLVLQQQNNRLEITRFRQNALPSIGFYANYSRQFTYNNFDYSLSQWWSPFSYVGLRFTVPITGNFKNYDYIREYRVRSLQTDLNLLQKTADITYEIQKASVELSNATQNMQTTKNNYELSKVIYENQKQQYNLGSLLYSGVLDTEKSLNLSEQNYIKAVYDFLLASINYQKAIGNY